MDQSSLDRYRIVAGAVERFIRGMPKYPSPEVIRAERDVTNWHFPGFGHRLT
jgi:hypothetical protein